MPLNPNDTLVSGQYRILRLLGRGGFGFVYQAQDTLLHQEVAIKEMIPALVGDESMLKRFLVEARATMEHAHEHIVRTYNVLQEGGSYYIVMECMSGGSLEDCLRERGSLLVDEAVRITAEICEGLGYAHQRGIVHCDLKPANILFASDGSAKVADFGIAHVSSEKLTRSWMTPAGFVAGTLPYMSPEQTDGVRDDPRLDIYALGAVLYRSLTGRTYLAFDQRETPRAQAENVNRIYEEKPEPPSTYSRLIPGWLDEVVLKALSKRPEERYATCAAMQAALEGRNAVAPTPLPAVKGTALLSSPRKHQARRPTRLWPIIGGAGVLLVAILVVTAMLFGSADSSETKPTPGPTEVAVATATSALAPTQSAGPTDAPAPAATLTPTETHTPTPTATPTIQPTEPPIPSNVYIEYVLDASDSMMESLSGQQTKLEAACSALAEHWQGLPDQPNLGLRALGHRFHAADAGSCLDTELLIPAAQGQLEHLISLVNGIEARGMSPLSVALREAGGDFTFASGRTNALVLIADETDNCGDDPCQRVQFQREAGIKYPIYVVGLDVDQSSRSQLVCIAETSSGLYREARTESELLSILDEFGHVIMASQ